MKDEEAPGEPEESDPKAGGSEETASNPTSSQKGDDADHEKGDDAGHGTKQFMGPTAKIDLAGDHGGATASPADHDKSPSVPCMEPDGDINAKYPSSTEGNQAHAALATQDDHVSDISGSEDGDDGAGKLPCTTDSRHHDFTIRTLLANTSSEHGSLRSHREHVDRLLMSSAGGSASSVVGSDYSNPRRGLERPTFAHTYDSQYYRRGDWLRMVPRRSSPDVRSDHSAPLSEHALAVIGSGSGGQFNTVHGDSPGLDRERANPHPGVGAHNPDRYYRGFDNTRIRMGTLRNPLSRMRAPGATAHGEPASEFLGTPPTLNGNISLDQGTSEGRAGETLVGYNVQYPHAAAHPPPHGSMFPSFIPGPIDEEEGERETGHAVEEGNMFSRNGSPASHPPLEIRCSLNKENEDGTAGVDPRAKHCISADSMLPPPHFASPPLALQAAEGDQRAEHSVSVDAMFPPPHLAKSALALRADVGHSDCDIDGPHYSEVMPNQQVVIFPSATQGPTPHHLTSPPPAPAEIREGAGGGTQFRTTLRDGDIVRPPHRPTAGHQPAAAAPPFYQEQLSLPTQLEEQHMHEASWDSKYAAYACRVDQSQGDRSVEIPIFSMARPHMRGFHYAWMTFFFAFLAWFAITPLLSDVQRSLGLTKEQIWTSNICSVAGAVVTRCVAGLCCDIYGARLMSAVVLVICGVPTIFTGFVNSAVGLSTLRLVTGIGGSAFVTCQYWTCAMFTREVAGTANALAAGWGNLGGAVAQLLVGSALFPLFKWAYSTAGTGGKDPADMAWRWACVLPGLMCTIFAFFVLRYSDDSPKGNYSKRKHLVRNPIVLRGVPQEKKNKTEANSFFH